MVEEIRSYVQLVPLTHDLCRLRSIRCRASESSLLPCMVVLAQVTLDLLDRIVLFSPVMTSVLDMPPPQNVLVWIILTTSRDLADRSITDGRPSFQTSSSP
ncbi:hypothetical protein I3842_02G111600 [Carya illinoinensis]|uniref:Uncharacterized protein n=1 Tax=Carya illinoinensis TaxID=32201 RepID=A0A922JZK9_CARIL|nr:hypothetical protein I3842_02G111600 [Carya illinoinensis]